MAVYDLAVIGGGIAGLGVFERAALAGLKVVLLERGKLAGATTAVTSGLLHGGLRYLPYDVATSRLMCREIARLRDEQPGLLKRQSFLWPVYRRHSFGMRLVEALQDYYDTLQDLRGSRAHARLSPREAAEALPGLNPDGLLGAISFDEWRVDVPGLVASLADAGRAAGGETRENARVLGFALDGGRIAAAKLAGGSELGARVFVNAAGPWCGEIARLADVSSVRLALRKGVHLVLEGEAPARGLILPGPGGRYVGVYPREGETWIGPTDDPYDGPPDEVEATPGEIAALRASLAAVLPKLADRPGRGVAGLRPIPSQRRAAALISRDHRVYDHARDGVSNFVTVAGGKLTTHRPMGEDVLSTVLEKLGRPAPTRTVPHRPWRNLAESAGLLAYFVARRALR